MKAGFLCAAAMAASMLTHPVVAAPQAATLQTATPPSAAVVDTRLALRDLWAGHIFWVRNVVLARLGGNDAQAKAAEQEVVANARALAGAIEPYYGKAASDGLFKLLAGHWGAISAYADATRAGKKADQDKAVAQLTDNANQIAVFLSGANPHWPKETLKGLLAAHGAHHVQQINQLQAKQYAEEAKTWAAMSKHMQVIADALASGLAAQFPDKFR